MIGARREPAAAVSRTFPLDLPGRHVDLAELLGDPRMARAPAVLRDGAGALRAIAAAQVAAEDDPRELAELIETTTAAMTAGAPLPADLAQAAGRVAAARSRSEVHSLVLANVANRLIAGFRQAAMRHTDTVLATVLRPHLEAVLARYGALVEAAQGRDLGDGGPFVKAPEAVQDAYAGVETLIADYTWLRAAQEVVLGAATTRDDSHNQAIAGGHHEVRDPYGYDHWPTEPRARLLRALRSGPWLPSVAQMNAALLGKGVPEDKPVETIEVVHHPSTTIPAPAMTRT